jgi:ubiquinone/menaquinone biosynthesis C-methylase UbiE
MTRHASEEQKVIKTYDHLAHAVETVGYRHNPIYLARKAVVDWDLMQTAGIVGKRVLNVGCFEPIDELIWASSTEEWTAVDLTPQAIETARRMVDKHLAPEHARRVKLQVMDAQRLEFSDNSFDVAVSFSVFDHIPNPGVRQRAVREMARVVKPGGHVVITVPNRYSYYHFMYERNVRHGVDLHVGYQYFYSRSELRKELRAAGLQIVRFTSDMKPVGDLPKIVRGLLMPFVMFGDRMGFLAQKPAR